jgi:hypothetical protein
MSGGVGWQLDTDVSGQNIGPILKGQAVKQEFFSGFLALEDETDMPRNVGKHLYTAWSLKTGWMCCFETSQIHCQLVPPNLDCTAAEP